MSHSINIVRIKAIQNVLSKLNEPIIFVGGATSSLYVDKDFEEQARPTDDVDIVVEIITYIEYAKLENNLRSLGFANDSASGVICRFTYQGIIIDVMPTSEKILGFSNRWYTDGYKYAIDYVIDNLHTVKIFTVAYFIASKLEAFNSRGKNDGRMSTDFEDIIFVLNNRQTVWQDFENAPILVNKYLKSQFAKLLNHLNIKEWISANLNYDEQERVENIFNNMNSFISK
jgi:predicted nucleotidyltransferase